MEGLPRTIPKSTERLKAQAEAFIADNIKEFSDEQKLLLMNTSELAKITDLDDLPEDLPADIRELIEENKDTYRNFLLEQAELVPEIEESIRMYNEEFRDVVEALQERILLANPKDMPEYLGEGTNGVAYKISVDGKDYAAKFSRSVTQALFENRPLKQAAAAGIDHVSKFVCHSAEDGVTIMELVPGTDITQFEKEQIPEYTEEDIEQLVDTVVELESAGLVIDPKASNFMYSEESGFSVLDYHVQSDGDGHITGKSLMSLMHALTYKPYEQIESNDPNAEETRAQQVVDHQRTHLNMMVRVFQIVREKYPELIQEWQETYDRELSEYYYNQENKIYPQGRPNDPLIKNGLPDTEEFLALIKQLEDLGIKTEEPPKPSALQALL